MNLFKFKNLRMPSTKPLALVAVYGALGLLSVGASAQSSPSINLISPGSAQALPSGIVTRSQAALSISYFSVSATPQPGGGYKMTGVCDGGHKAKIAGRKNGTTGNNTVGTPAIMFEFELICNRTDPTNPPIFAPVAGKPNTYTFNTNILLSSTTNPGVSPGLWTVTATQRGSTTAPIQDIALPLLSVTF